MADEVQTAPTPTPTKAAPTSTPSHADTDGPLGLHLTVRDYCMRKLGAGGSPEMLNAFHRAETTAGRVKDSIASFDARLTAFADLPA